MQGGNEMCGFLQQFMSAKQSNLTKGAQLRYRGHRAGLRRILRQSERTAGALLRWEVRPGDTVLVCMPQVPELFFITLAIWRLGATLHILPPDFNWQAYPLSQKASLLFVAEPYLHHLEAQADAMQLPRTVLLPVKEAALGYGNSPRNGAFTHDGPLREHKLMLFKDFLSSGQKIRRVDPAPYQPSQVALVCYTGEGFQRRMSQEECVAYLHAACRTLPDATSALRVVNALPLWQASGLLLLFACLLCGHCLLLGVDSVNDRLLARILNEKADRLYADPSFFDWALQREGLSAQQKIFFQAQLQHGLWGFS